MREKCFKYFITTMSLSAAVLVSIPAAGNINPGGDKYPPQIVIEEPEEGTQGEEPEITPLDDKNPTYTEKK